MIREIEIAELEHYLLERLKQYGVPSPENRAKASLSQLNDEDKKEIAKEFLVYELDGKIVAGASLADGKYLQNTLFNKDKTLLTKVIDALKERSGDIRFYLNSIPENLGMKPNPC